MLQFDGLVFEVVSNNGKVEELMKLNELKNVVASQLSQLSKVQITKNIFHPCYESLVMKKQGTDAIIGGTTFMLVPASQVCCLEYLAISKEEMRKGYGGRLLSALKKICLDRSVKMLSVQADELVVQFYQKHGFLNIPRRPSLKWLPYLPQYSHTKLLMCKLCEGVNYLQMDAKIKVQRKLLTSLLDGLQYRQFSYKSADIDQLLQAKLRNYGVKTSKMAIKKGEEKDSEEIGKLKERSILEAKLVIAYIKDHPHCWVLRPPLLGSSDNEKHGILNIHEIEELIIQNPSMTISQKICSEIIKTLETMSRYLPGQHSAIVPCKELIMYVEPLTDSIFNGTFSISQNKEMLVRIEEKQRKQK